MRYLEVPDIIFTRQDGESFQVKGLREFPDDYNYTSYVSTGAFSKLDLIASLKEVYEDESQTFKLFDFNKVRLVNNFFNLKEMKTVRIPE